MDLEDLSRRVLDVLPVGVLVRDADGTCVYANEECLRLLGRGVQPEPGERAASVHPVTLAGAGAPYPEHQDPLLRALRGEASRVDDMEVHTPGGPLVLVATGTPLVGPDGTVRCALATYAASSTSPSREGGTAEAVFAGLLNQELHTVALLDADGTLLEANHRPFEISGWRREDAVGRPLWETPWWSASPALSAQVRASVRRAANGEALVEEGEYFLAEGGRRTTLRALSPLRDNEGAVKYVLLVAHDVTDQRQAERTARQLAAVVEGSVDFVALTDARERVHYVNPAGRVLVGLPATGTAPVPLTDYLSEEGLWRLRDEAEPALAQTGTWRGESQLRHFPSGTTIDVYMTATILPDAPDEEAGVAFVCQDLRERRRIEAALAEALRR